MIRQSSSPWWCVLLWAIRLVFTANVDSQKPHANGFSPVWWRLWISSCLLYTNNIRHSPHSNWYIECTAELWVVRLLWSWKTTPHFVQGNCTFISCLWSFSRWRWKFTVVANRLWQRLHLYSLSMESASQQQQQQQQQQNWWWTLTAGRHTLF